MTTFFHSLFNHIKDSVELCTTDFWGKYLQEPNILTRCWSSRPCLFLYAIRNVWHHMCSRCWIHCNRILILGHLFLQIVALSIIVFWVKSIVFINCSMRRFPSVKTVWRRDSHCYRKVNRELHNQAISSTWVGETQVSNATRHTLRSEGFAWSHVQLSPQ